MDKFTVYEVDKFTVKWTNLQLNTSQKWTKVFTCPHNGGIIIIESQSGQKYGEVFMNEITKKEARFCQADELIKALHIMNNTELKFMFYSLSQRKAGDTEITTTMADLISQLKLDWGGEQVKTYKKAIKSIIQKSVISVEMGWDRLSEADRKRLKKPTDTVLVSGALMSAKLYPDMTIDLSFNKDFIPMLDDLRHDFTWIYLEQIARLNGKYSPRLYEWCKMQLKDKNECNFIWYLNGESKEAPSLRKQLDIGNKYSDWRDLKKRVIMPSIEEINENTSDIKVSFKPLRNGARTPIYALDMHIEAKHKTNKIAQKKAKKNKKSTVELDEKFYEVKEKKSDEQLQRECDALRERIANQTLGTENTEGMSDDEFMKMVLNND